ncbi:MAG: hypothetical protein IJ113_08520, partial [Eggerthellaceae bacterium]|nr:hypothetical protein [Eggerthellaceae bacterium]
GVYRRKNYVCDNFFEFRAILLAMLSIGQNKQACERVHRKLPFNGFEICEKNRPKLEKIVTSDDWIFQTVSRSAADTSVTVTIIG